MSVFIPRFHHTSVGWMNTGISNPYLTVSNMVWVWRKALPRIHKYANISAKPTPLYLPSSIITNEPRDLPILQLFGDTREGQNSSFLVKCDFYSHISSQTHNWTFLISLQGQYLAAILDFYAKSIRCYWEHPIWRSKWIERWAFQKI